jgi:8-oxoguanine deaminase
LGTQALLQQLKVGMKTKRTAAFVIGYADGDHVIYPGGEVVYENDTIIFVGHDYPEPVDRIIDAGLAIVSPGFIDLDALADIDHAILDCWNSPDLDPGLYWSERYFATARHDVFTPEEEALKRRYALTQLILNGITTAMPIAAESYKGWCESYDEFVEVAAIAAELGLRMYLGPSYRSGVNVVRMDGQRDVLWDEEQGLEGLRGAIKFVETHNGAHGDLIRGCLLPARIETCSYDVLQRTREAADSLNCLVRLHCLQSKDDRRFLRAWYDQTPLGLLNQLGLLGPRLLIPHAVLIGGHSQLDEPYGGERELLREAGTSIIHCPLASARYAHALETFDSYRLAGVNVALGTDTFPPDMIRVMDYGSSIGKVIDGRKSSHAAADFFRAATLGGAQALGRDDLGRLVAGAKADMITVDLGTLRTGPIDDPIRTLVMNCTGANISSVVIGGRTVMEGGQIPGVDLDALRVEGQRYFEKMKRAYPERDYLGRPIDRLFPPSFSVVKRTRTTIGFFGDTRPTSPEGAARDVAD